MARKNNPLNLAESKLKDLKEFFKKRTEDQENFVKIFLENSISMGITTLNDGRFIEVSNAFLKLMGCNRDEIVGHTSIETGFISPEDRALFFQEMDQKGRIENYEMNFRMKGGVLRHGLFNAVKISLGNEMYLLTVMADISDRKKAEKELKISEENYRSLFDNSPIGLYQVDPQSGRFIRANHVAARILGYESPEELMNSVTDITSQVYVNPEDREKALGWLKKDGFFNDFELQNRRKDGSIVWVLASVKIVRDDEGNILYHEGTNQDITEAKQAREALRLSEEKYRRLHESMMDGFVSGDLRGYAIEANDAFLNMLGYSREELHRLNYKKITPKKWHAVDKVIMKEQLLTRGYSDIFEKEYIRKDGTIFPVELRTTLLSDENGNSIGFWAIVRDITERKQSEEALKKSYEKYRVIAENIIDCIALVDKGGLIQYVSNFAEVVGYEPEELMNINALSLTHPDDLERVRRIYHDSINRGWREIIYETRIRHKNGEYLPLEIRERVLKDSHENFIGSVCVVRKIIQRQQKEQLSPSLDQNYVDGRLTARENEILSWVMKGKSTWDIATILAISESTVKFHVDNIMKKFKAVNRVHAVAIALQRQEIDFD